MRTLKEYYEQSCIYAANDYYQTEGWVTLETTNDMLLSNKGPDGLRFYVPCESYRCDRVAYNCICMLLHFNVRVQNSIGLVSSAI